MVDGGRLGERDDDYLKMRVADLGVVGVDDMDTDLKSGRRRKGDMGRSVGGKIKERRRDRVEDREEGEKVRRRQGGRRQGGKGTGVPILTFRKPEVPLASRLGPEASTKSWPLAELRSKTGVKLSGTTGSKN